MPQAGVGAAGGQMTGPLGLIQNLPRRGEQGEAADDENRAEEVEGPEVGIPAPAEEHLQEVAGIVGEPVRPRKAAGEPAGEEIDGQREAVHLGEQRHQKGRKGPERAPVAWALRLCGLAKLKAKMMKTRELMSTRDHRP